MLDWLVYSYRLQEGGPNCERLRDNIEDDTMKNKDIRRKNTKFEVTINDLLILSSHSCYYDDSFPQLAKSSEAGATSGALGRWW